MTEYAAEGHVKMDILVYESGKFCTNLRKWLELLFPTVETFASFLHSYFSFFENDLLLFYWPLEVKENETERFSLTCTRYYQLSRKPLYFFIRLLTLKPASSSRSIIKNLRNPKTRCGIKLSVSRCINKELYWSTNLKLFRRLHNLAP